MSQEPPSDSQPHTDTSTPHIPHDANQQTQEQSLSWKQVFIGKMPFKFEMICFIVVSTLDLILTYFLLQKYAIFESNPLARFFIDHWGLKGMVTYKFSLVAFIMIIVQMIAKIKQQTALSVLRFGIAVQTAVVIYSVYLVILFYG